MRQSGEQFNSEIIIQFPTFRLPGELRIPDEAIGVVLFAHGSGSSRHSPRNQFVARTLRQHGLGTILFDLLTAEEEDEDRNTGQIRFDIDLLAERLIGATEWLHQKHPKIPRGYFGSSTGAGAALVAAARSNFRTQAIVSRGGRPDLAGAALAKVKAPTLLIVGSEDTAVREMNRDAMREMDCHKELRIIEGATHLFEEPGALEQVAELAANWFVRNFSQNPSSS